MLKFSTKHESILDSKNNSLSNMKYKQIKEKLQEQISNDVINNLANKYSDEEFYLKFK